MALNWRLGFVGFILLLAVSGLLWRMVDLTVVNRNFLRTQGDARTLRFVEIPAYRGVITDRNGEPLAISTPVDSIWVNPKEFNPKYAGIATAARLLKLSKTKLLKRASPKSTREFVYLKRRLSPHTAKQILALKIPGIHSQREYRRYYPEGEVTAHLLGFTNIDDNGQEGLELAYNKWLKGTPGKKEVLKDRLGRTVEEIASIRPPAPGHELVMSIDRRIQYLAYRDLKDAVRNNKAQSGSIVVLDSKTGEVLAMANAPSFNPNKRPAANDGRYRNRAMTDVFEPGSTIKTFSVVNALESQKYTAGSKVNTSPGWMMLDGHEVRDSHDHGTLDITQILQKSSNIGISKLTLSLPSRALWETLRAVGFGKRSQTGFPGEVAGSLVDHRIWRPFVLATLSFGYGLAVTPLQLARAYAVLADGGVEHKVSLLKRETPDEGQQIFQPAVTNAVLAMLETVTESGGTAPLARVPGYRVAGKTGTVRKVGPNGYDEKHHLAIFVGTAPLSDPRLVTVVVINDPQGKSYYGGAVAAPVFAKVMAGALRILDISPDELRQDKS